MITSLSKLTMRQYIELVCGDVSVLKGSEIVSAAELENTRKRLIYEYSCLSDDAGSKIFLNKHVARMRAKAELTMFQCLNNALLLGASDDVRNVLKEYGITRKMDDSHLVEEVKRLLYRAKTNVKRAEEESAIVGDRHPSTDEIRTQFDRQAASLMTYFKFQIDLDKITASQFACMADQAYKQIKAQIAEMSKI